jgi:hypothetical protein
MVEGLIREVAEFILHTAYDDLPADVVELGRKSILDEMGLALCGSVARQGTSFSDPNSFGGKHSRNFGLPRGARDEQRAGGRFYRQTQSVAVDAAPRRPDSVTDSK